MTAMTEHDRQRLITVLEAYGADPARWPIADRHLASLDGSMPGWREARALDRALASATTPPLPAGLSARLGVAARPAADNVVQFAPRKSARVLRWPAAAALAASLAIGIYIGALNPGDLFFPSTDTASLDDPLDLMNLDQADDADTGDQV